MEGLVNGAKVLGFYPANQGTIEGFYVRAHWGLTHSGANGLKKAKDLKPKALKEPLNFQGKSGLYFI